MAFETEKEVRLIASHPRSNDVIRPSTLNKPNLLRPPYVVTPQELPLEIPKHHKIGPLGEITIQNETTQKRNFLNCSSPLKTSNSINHLVIIVSPMPPPFIGSISRLNS